MKLRVLPLCIATGLMSFPLASWAATNTANYWLSVTTDSGGMGSAMTKQAATESAGGFLGGLFGSLSSKVSGPTRTLSLQLNSPQSLPAGPNALHDIPKGMSMGDSLPLVIPEFVTSSAEKEEQTPFERGEKPKGRLLIYWGCGDKTGSGQPKVIDFAKVTSMAGIPSHHGSAVYPPSPSRGKIYAAWPNKENSKRIPSDASLVGDHFVHGNYTPDIRFSIGKQQDFMAPVELSNNGNTLKWKDIPTSIGFFIMASGSNANGDMIVWTSSREADTGWGMMDFMPTPDVRKFVKNKVVLPGDASECTVPTEVADKSQGLMVQMIAYGEDMNAAWPAKPEKPQAYVKVRLKSVGSLMLGGTSGAAKAGGGSYSAAGGRSYSSPPKEKSDSEKAIDGVKSIRGLFGF